MKKFIIDRFEGGFAVCEQENKDFISIPKYKLPLNCKEGDCLILDAGGMYQMDSETTKSSEKRILDKMNRLIE